MRRFFALILVAVFVVMALPLAILAGSYKTFTSDDLPFEQLHSLYSEFLKDSLWHFFEQKEVESVDEGELNDLIDAHLDLAYFLDSFQEMIKGWADVEVGDNKNLVLGISYDKFFVQGEEVFYQDLALIVNDNLPDCAEGVSVVPMNYDCLPEDFANADLTAYLKIELDRYLFSRLPNNFHLNFVFLEPGSSLGGLFSSFFLNVLKFYLVIMLFLLLWIGVLIEKPFSRVFKWISMTFFEASLLIIMVAGFIMLVPAILDYSISAEFESVQDSYFIFLQGIFSSLLKAIAQTILTYALPLCLIALFAWILLAKRHKKVKYSQYDPL